MKSHSTMASGVPERALGTLPRLDKGQISPPPVLDGLLSIVAESVAAWPEIIATAHWHFVRRSEVDGIDFYLGEHELGHIHLDGWIHLATSPQFGRTLIDAGLAQPFRYGQGWVEARIKSIGSDAGIDLFRRNYDRLAAS